MAENALCTVAAYNALDSQDGLPRIETLQFCRSPWLESLLWACF